MQNQASSEAMRMSQAEIISTAPPTHAEWMTAITGFGHSAIAVNESCHDLMCW